jgi:hypothetical protein
MKQKLMLAAMLLLAAFFTCAQEYKNLAFSPSKPSPGDVIKFEYSTPGTTLGGTNDFEAIAYINDGQVRAQEIQLTADGDKWKGAIPTNDSTKVVFIVFKKDKLIDNNREQGYSLMLYKNGEPVKGAYGAMADVNTGIGSYLMQLKADPLKNLEWYDKEFSRNPGYKSVALGSYAGLLLKADKATAKEKIKPFIDELNAKKNKTESDYQTMIWTSQRLGDKEAVEEFKAETLKKFPKGMQVKTDKIEAFYNEKDPVKKEALLTALIKAYPPKTGFIGCRKKRLDYV